MDDREIRVRLVDTRRNMRNIGGTRIPTSSEISVIVQGPIAYSAQAPDRTSPTTAEVLKSIRAHLPGAELILSTWPDQDLSQLDYDILVTNDDPGSLPSPPFNLLVNTARQIVSTSVGLSKASRPFSLKLRTDTSLSSNELLRTWSAGQDRGLSSFILSSKVLTSAVFTCNPARTPTPYCVSDFFHFGRTEDIRRLWNIRLPKLDDAQRWQTRWPSRCWRWLGGTLPIINGLNTEQYLFIEFLRNSQFEVSLKRRTTLNPFCSMRSDRFLATCFVIADPEATGINLPPRFSVFVDHRTYRNDTKSPLFCAKSEAGALLRLGLRLVPYSAACAREPFRRLFAAANNLADVHFFSRKTRLKNALKRIPGGGKIIAMLRRLKQHILEW